MRTTRALAVSALVLAVAGCSGAEDPQPAGTAPSGTATAPARIDPDAEGSAPTLDQATILANALYADAQAGGATFELTIPMPDGEVHATGLADWAHQQGRVTFAPESVASTGVAEAYWNADGVIKPAGPAGDATATWTFSPADRSAPFDRAISIVAALASRAQDNPVLLQQRGARWLGTEEADGEHLEVFRSGGLLLWIEPEGRVRRAEAYVDGLPGRIAVVLREHGPQPVTLPPVTP